MTCYFVSFTYLDHTLQTEDGWYMDTSSLKSNQTARLISTMSSIPSRGICFRFWYRAYGSKQGKLNLLQKASDEQTKWVSGLYAVFSL